MEDNYYEILDIKLKNIEKYDKKEALNNLTIYITSQKYKIFITNSN